MSYTLTINSTEIEAADIASIPNSVEKLDFDNKILPDTYKIKLDNTDKTYYDDRYPASFFYASDFYGWPFDLYDDDNENYIFKGVIKNITVSDSNNVIEIEATNYIEKLSKKNTVYTNSSNKTIAQIIYELLTDAACGAIDTSVISYDGFQDAINIQTTNSAYIDITYVEKDSKTLINVINELLRMSQCSLYTSNNFICMYQWQQWGGITGERITSHDILPKTYKHYYNQDNVKNSYSVAYDNAGSVLYATGSDSSSISKFGTRPFNIPNDKVNSTTSTDFKILFRNSTGATWAGALALTRYQYIQKYFELEMSYQKNYIQLAEQIDLAWYPFYGEPGQIVEREIDIDKKIIKVTGLFLNAPHQYYARDYTPPDPVFIEAAFPLSNEGIFLKFTKNFDTDWVGYKIYFTSSNGEWFQEICHLGISPIDNKNTDTTVDGFCFAEIHQLETGVNYYFKITAYDTSGNESLDSNIVQCRTYATTTLENFYRCKGNIFEDYLYLDKDNSIGGTVPSDFDTYADNLQYGVDVYGYAAIYESGYYYNSSGWTFVSWVAISHAGDIYFQYRTSEDGATYTSWSSASDAVSTSSITFSSNKYFQLRFLFDPDSWLDSDYVYIDDVG